MKRIELNEEDINAEKLEDELNQLFYKIRSLIDRTDITKEQREKIQDCLDGNPNGMTGVQSLIFYLKGKSIALVELEEGKKQYIKVAPIDPKIIYGMTNQLIYFINDTLGIKEDNEPSMSKEETEQLKQDFDTAYKQAVQEGIKSYYKSIPSQEEIDAAIEVQFKDITEEDIKTKSFTDSSGKPVEIKQIPLSRELAKVLDCEYLFDPILHETPGITTVLEQITIQEDGKPKTSFQCQRYNSIGNSRGIRQIKDDEAIVKLIADKFRHVTEKSKISPSDALKAALSSGITPDDTAAIPEGPEEPETAKGEPTNDE